MGHCLMFVVKLEFPWVASDYDSSYSNANKNWSRTNTTDYDKAMSKMLQIVVKG